MEELGKMVMEEFDRRNRRVLFESSLLSARRDDVPCEEIKKMIASYEIDSGEKYLPLFSDENPMDQEEISKWKFVIDAHILVLERVSKNPTVISGIKDWTHLIFKIITGEEYPG